ncbi:MAG: DUF333 domain-containing protein [Moraxella sp.]|nr:DUF333 domain-containing protein [Moraxella sp.]
MNAKMVIGVMMASVAITGCANLKSTNSQAIGMANPASEYCISVGGKLEAKRDSEGNEYALCHLPNGKVVEEWELFRSAHK